MDNKGFEGDDSKGISNQDGKQPTNGNDTSNNAVDTRYGWFGWKPDCLQKINKPIWLLVFMSIFSFMQGFIINGLYSVSISTLEKRFDLSSRKTGLITSSYDIPIALLVVFVSYYGGRGHKARWTGIGCIIFAVGNIIFSLPHFTTGLYQDTSTSLACSPDDPPGECKTSSVANYFYVFIFANVLHGIAIAPLYSIGITLLDESVTVHKSAIYLGVFYGLATIGPGVGNIIGGVFLNIYTDAGSVDVDAIGLTPDDTGWVGAWWFGFLIGGILDLLLAIPILGFPSELPDTAAIRAAKESQAHQSKYNEHVNHPSFGDKLSDFPRALKFLLHNPAFVFLTIIGCFEGFIIGGYSAFGPKIVETKFGLSASTAALLFGAIAIPGAGFGTVLGGYLTKRWKLKVRGMLKMSIIVTSVAMVAVFCFLVRCSQESLVGINVGYHGNIANAGETLDLTNECNADCNCQRTDFNPVCGDNGLEYFDPCFAGCAEVSEDRQQFSNCSCLSLGSTNTSLTATIGKCDNDCNLLPVFLIGTLVMMVFFFIAGIPAIECILRVVPESQRSLAFGVQWLAVRVLGTIPGPIAFGAAFDTSCILWQQDCNGNQGSCFLYDGVGVSWKFFLMGFAFMTLGLIFWILTLWIYKGPPQDEEEKEIAEEKP